MKRHFWKGGLFAELILLFLAGCVPAKVSTPTLLPTEPNITDTPVSLESPTGKNLPPGGPSGVPAAPNSSLIQARIIATTQDDRGTVLTVEVLSSQKQEGYADFGSAVIGKQIEVLVVADTIMTFSVDQIIQGELSYTGDEHGGVYFLQNISQP